jgi:predicted SAM-dependent methyltransferase
VTAPAALRRHPLLGAVIRHAAALRREIRHTRARARAARTRDREIARYLAAHAVRKLQIGADRNLLAGWLNTDLQLGAETCYLDAREPLPFGDASFDYAFSEHLIEHVGFEEGLALLRELLRVLRPGGRVRIATPNLAALARLYADPAHESMFLARVRDAAPDLARHDRASVVNRYFRAWGHEFLYDPAALARSLCEAGFVDVVECAIGQSDDPELRGLEGHGRVIGEALNALETFVLEARRPESH